MSKRNKSNLKEMSFKLVVLPAYTTPNGSERNLLLRTICHDALNQVRTIQNKEIEQNKIPLPLMKTKRTSLVTKNENRLMI